MNRTTKAKRKCIHVLISGKVQGVFFRASCKERAEELGIAGWVKNLPDGSVEAVFEGPEAQLTAMLAWCMEGPEHAHVTHIEKSEEPVEGLTSFDIRNV